MKEIAKMSKKEKKAYYAKNRVVFSQNLGSRDMQTEKHPSRVKRKRLEKREFFS